MSIRKILSMVIVVCLLATQVAIVAFADEILAEVIETVEETAEQEETKVETEAVTEVAAEEKEEETKEPEDVKAEEAEASAEVVLTAELDDVIVTLKADKDAFENEGELSLVVTPVEIENTEEEAALDAVEKENVAKRATYDITVLDGETPIEPVKEVKVYFELKDTPSGADGVNIYHHDEDEGIEKIATQVLKDDVKEETVKVGEAKAEKDIEIKDVTEEELADTDDVAIIDDVTVDGFSLYTVDFTYKDKTISIAGDSTGNKLDDIVSQLGIKEEVTEATAYQDEECTEEAANNEVKSADGETLYSVYEEGDTWYVDAVNAFQTEHGLVIKTADGAEYKIKVTDAVLSTDPLTFTALVAGSTVKIVKENNPDHVSLEYNKGNGSWMTYKVGDEITLDNINDKVCFRGSTATFSKVGNYYKFVMSGKIEASGSVNSLINDADLSPFCYNNMFLDCTSLTTAPSLPATTLADSCYEWMFSGCTSLTTAPSLPATLLASSCYNGMFNWCTSLTVAPSLPATTLADLCYSNMFKVCTSITEAPSLPATILAESCYSNMFRDCTKLTEAPSLPATTLEKHCYYCMFEGCRNLNISDKGGITIFTYPSSTSAKDTCTDMFKGCKGFSGTPMEGKTYYHLGPMRYSCPKYNAAGDPTSGINKWDTKSVAEYTVISDSDKPTIWGTAGVETWYVVHGTVDYGTLTDPKTIRILGTVHLILMDGCNLIVKGAQENAGICVTGGGNSLTIYAQSTGANAGKLSATGSGSENYGGAGIGGGRAQMGSNITINGGVVTAISEAYGAGIGGGSNGAGSNIIINGGTVTATSGEYGAGIGGGYIGEGSRITINGGIVIATGGFFGAGIGGCHGSGSEITINGRIVIATGGVGGAGIGGGYDDGKNITINGGEIVANGGGYGAGIGGGCYGVGRNININNGQVSASSCEYKGDIASGIGNGCFAIIDASKIFAATDVIVKAGTSANPIAEIIHTATTDIANDLAGKQYVRIEMSNDPGPIPPGGDEPTTKSISSGGEVWTAVPSSYGSLSAPVTNGIWVNTNGTFTYAVNGQPLKNAMAWITYTGSDGKQYTGCFYFDKNGNMQMGWQLIDNIWYYFEPTAGSTQGMMKVTGWVETNGKLYYLGADGKMLVNTTTPDGKRVGADGALIQ